MRTIRTEPMTNTLLFAISLYRKYVSPLFPATCRFTPTCSRYAADAIRTYGAGRGSWMALRRIARCHPFHTGGEDPVPGWKKGDC